MSREDIGYLFPNKFVLGMKLYKIIQSCRQEHDITESEYENDNVSCISNSSSQSTYCTPTSSRLGKRSCSNTSSPSTISDVPTTKRQKSNDNQTGFVLPVFSEDIQKPFLQDAVFTTSQRNKIIRECCRALQGYCRDQKIPITSELKKHMAKLLSEKCPNSLGVEVSIIHTVAITATCVN